VTTGAVEDADGEVDAERVVVDGLREPDEAVRVGEDPDDPVPVGADSASDVHPAARASANAKTPHPDDRPRIMRSNVATRRGGRNP
jgi:hypothetical protein